MRLTYIDIFAGAGGLSEGFQQNGFYPVAHVEMKREACLTLKTRCAYHYLKENDELDIYKKYLRNLVIYVSIFVDSNKQKTVSQGETDAAIKRAIQLYHKAINDLYTSFEKDNDTYEFAISTYKHKDDIRTVKICALTNGIVKPINLNSISIGSAEVSFSLWDIDRLYRCVMSGKMRETIEIDFSEKYYCTIPCIENTTSDKYSVYLAIISGELLANLYDEYRDRLLEKNVRSFLQVNLAFLMLSVSLMETQ